MPLNQAAWLVKSAKQLEVKTAPYTSPGKGEIVVKNAALAVNPVDWVKLDAGSMIFRYMKYPFIHGSDIAGEVVELGSGVQRFKVGDRVVGHAISLDPNVNKSSEGAFQQYTVIRSHAASLIPDSLSYEKACVLPLGLSTAACGLFQKDMLALEYPSTNPRSTGETLLVWGGSTSVGSNAIQLAVAAGYEVLTTCSPKNFDYVKSLGAYEAFDYNSPTVIRDIIGELKTKKVAGAISIGNGSTEACAEILAASKGNRFIAQASMTLPGPGLTGTFPSSTLGWVSTGMYMVWSGAKNGLKDRTNGINKKFIFGTSLFFNEVGKKIYEDFLPAALAGGKFVCAPDSQIVGHGLECIQEALDLNKKGVSARKLVVTL